MSRARIEGVDVARGVASLIMIQGHAYDGWVAAEHKESAAYLFTRLLGTLPLPAFLVLAGAAIVLRVDAARARGEDASKVRRSVLLRGFGVLGWAYAVSFAYAAMDGVDGLDTLLRADVLHVIGLSIMAFALLGIGACASTPSPGGVRARSASRGAEPPRGIVSPRRMTIAALALLIVPTLLCPWLSPLGAEVHGPLRFAVALFVDVPGVTLMPFVPLVSWLAAGALVAMAMLRARESAPPSLAGAPDRFFVIAGASALVVAIAASHATSLTVDALGGTLTRAHPAVWLNVIDLAARGVLVLAIAALLSTRVPAAVRRVLVRIGRGSLLAYVVHIPLCYGRAGELLRGRLDMATATLFVLLLMVFAWLAVLARDSWRARGRCSVSSAT